MKRFAAVLPRCALTRLRGITLGTRCLSFPTNNFEKLAFRRHSGARRPLPKTTKLPKEVKTANDPNKLLNLFRDDSSKLSEDAVSRVFSKFAQLAKQSRFTGYDKDPRFRRMCLEAEGVCSDLTKDPTRLSVVLSTFAKLPWRPSPAFLAKVSEADFAEEVDSFSFEDLSWILWALTKLKSWPSHSLLDGLISRLERAPPGGLQAPELQAIIWSLAKVAVGTERQTPLYNALATRVGDLASGLNSAQLALMLWGLAKANYTISVALGGKLMRRATVIMQDFLPHHLSITLWALGKHRASPDASFLSSFEVQALTKLERLGTQELSNLLLGYANLQVQPSEHLLDAVSERIVKKASQFCAQEVANVFWSFGKMGTHSSQPLFRALSVQAEKLAPEFDSQNLTNTIWAFATLGTRPSAGLLHSLSLRVVQRERDHKPRHVSNLFWAFATLNLRPATDVTETLSRVGVTKIAGFSGLAISNIFWSFSTLRVPLPKAFRDQLYSRLGEVVAGLDNRSLTKLLMSFAKLGTSPPPTLVAALLEHGESAADGMNSLELSQVLWACAVLKTRPPPDSLLLRRLLTFTPEDLNVRQSHQLHQFFLFFFGSSDPPPRFHQIVAKCREVFSRSSKNVTLLRQSDLQSVSGRSEQPHSLSLQAEVSSLVREIVGDACAAAGCLGSVEVLDEVLLGPDGGYYTADIEVRGRGLPLAEGKKGLLVEVYGPWHYLAFSGRKEQADCFASRQLNGSTQLKVDYLQEQGWVLVEVPHFLCDLRRKSRQENKEFLQGLLRSHLPAPGQSNKASEGRPRLARDGDSSAGGGSSSSSQAGRLTDEQQQMSVGWLASLASQSLQQQQQQTTKAMLPSPAKPPQQQASARDAAATAASLASLLGWPLGHAQAVVAMLVRVGGGSDGSGGGGNQGRRGGGDGGRGGVRGDGGVSGLRLPPNQVVKALEQVVQQLLYKRAQGRGLKPAAGRIPPIHAEAAAAGTAGDSTKAASAGRDVPFN